ncbi:MAG TPA: type II toxin-antitoxin system RatA family toxin, partial [Aestuariivirga sp.]|nr:type II toxin-antitoxin system RatA family toxin [Aestuariivirga sp.]
LVSQWKIRRGVNGGSEIQFTVDYTLKSRSLQFLLSGMFDLIVRRVMAAFEARAKTLYGTPVAA